MTTIALIIALACCSYLGYKLRKLSKQHLTVAVINQQTFEQAKQLELEIQSKKDELSRVRESVKAQDNVLKSLKALGEDLRKRATEEAEQTHEIRTRELNLQYQQLQDDLDSKYREKCEEANKWLEEELSKLTAQERQIRTQVQKESKVLEDLKAKQAAYLEDKKREREIEEKRDFYRLVLTEEELADVQSLRRIQPSFSRKDSIDKIIWENYYKTAYDLLMGRLNLTPSKKVCGIYKITHLDNGLCYVGQSVDIRERWRTHIKSALEHKSTSNKLYQAMRKYGVEAFTFEVLEEVPRAQLNEREVYWIDFYKTKEVGLNSTRGGS